MASIQKTLTSNLMISIQHGILPSGKAKQRLIKAFSGNLHRTHFLNIF